MSARAGKTPQRRALEQAIDWTVILQDSPVGTAEQAAFNAWLAADRLNALSWAQVQGHLQQTLAPLNGEPGRALRHALQTPDTSRRQLLRGALVVAGVGACGGLLSQPGLPLAQLGADQRTGTGERRVVPLDDGSQLQLDARSAVDIAFSTSARTLTLRAGKLLIDAQPDMRPLQVLTPFGTVQTSAARFMVALHEQSAHVWVLDEQVQVVSREHHTQQLRSGHGARMAEDVRLLAANRSGEASWHSGMLEVDNWPLGDVIEALRPYQPGVLRISAQAAALPVSGVISLDDSARALRSLEQTMPLRITRYLGWWTRIELA
ncbi:FecR domain-containing protein [Pseudomonas putida]|uniref:FecR domain-containing protein n=1 Tax=Pseudomonas putida TaxID=303 RepID=UPI002365DDCB|nr:FecR domain-containing protein [Pseudomonas putida]MDD2050270.1 FecR domain-containing protein [Pseudomonas putida]